MRGLRKMVDADSYCPDVVVQVASVTRALQEVAVGLLTEQPTFRPWAARGAAS